MFEQNLSPYQALVGLLVEEDQPAEALLVAERAKARVLLEVLAQGRVNVTKAMTAAEVQEERDIERELIDLNAQIAYRSRGPGRDDAQVGEPDRTAARDTVPARGVQDQPLRRASGAEGAAQRRGAVHAADATALLGERDASTARTAILEFVVTADATYVFVIAPVGCSTTIQQRSAGTRRPGRRPCASRAASWRRVTAKLRDQLAARDPGFRDASAALFDLLVAPVRAHLKDAGRLIIVPDGVLWELPFQALWQSDRGAICSRVMRSAMRRRSRCFVR